MRYSAREFQYSTPTSPIVGLANLPADFTATPELAAQMFQRTGTVTQSLRERGVFERLAPAATGNASELCACYVQQVGDAYRSQVGSSMPSDARAQAQAQCLANPAAFKTNAASALGLNLSDVCESKSNTWLWVAGGAAVLGAAFYLLRK